MHPMQCIMPSWQDPIWQCLAQAVTGCDTTSYLVRQAGQYYL